MLELLVATRNRKKLAELQALLAGLPVAILNLDQVGDVPEVIEDGATLEENAAKKASETARASGLHAMADDSGLFVDALGGRPGVRSACYAGDAATTEKLCRKLIGEMADVRDDRRGSHFRCCIAMADPDGQVVLTASGRVDGAITRQMRGSGGFGYDPVFHYAPEGATFAELVPERKNAVSHRGRALQEFRARLAEHLDSGDD